MDRVVMPELITPMFAEVIASNPEVLKMIVDHQPNEEVIVGQNCTLDCNCNPTNVKLVFCNVTIGLQDTENECGEGRNAEETEEQVGGCHIKIGGSDLNQKGLHWVETSGEVIQLELEIAVLEARMNEAEKILRLIPRQSCNRKLIARCKLDVNEALESLSAKKRELENQKWLMQSGR